MSENLGMNLSAMEEHGRKLRDAAVRARLIAAGHHHLVGSAHSPPLLEVSMSASYADGSQEAAGLVEAWVRKNWDEVKDRIVAELAAEAADLNALFGVAQVLREPTQ